MTKVRAQVNEETNKGQLPWGHTNLIGSVYLNGAAAPAGRGAPLRRHRPRLPPRRAPDVELEFWRSIKDSNKPEELNAYLTNYPNGQFKSLALARIASLENGPSTATRNLTTGIDPATFTEEANQTTEDQIGLDKGQRRDVQRRLTGLGFDTKVTGKFDETTRAVITRWQAARGYPKSGYLNKLQHKALLTEIVATTPSASSSDEGTPCPPPGQQQWRRQPTARPAAAQPQHSDEQRRSRSGRCRPLHRRRGRRHAPLGDSAPTTKPGIIPGFFISFSSPHVGPAQAHRLRRIYLPAAFRSASLIRSCQPGPALLEVLQHVLVDPQRDQLLHAGQRGRLRRRLRDLGGGALERRLGLGARVVQGSRPPRLVRHRSNSFKQHGRQIALGERRHDGQDGLAGSLRPLADLQRRRDRGARGNAARNALVPRQRARGFDRGCDC